MRKILGACSFALLVAFATAPAMSGEYTIGPVAANGGSGGVCNNCNNGNGGRHGHHGHHGGGGHHGNRRIEGNTAYYNCSCNGSYKYPVPPLYTYHWVGQFSAPRMTDYHSPWRFPPLKPYTEETSVMEAPAPLFPAKPDWQDPAPVISAPPTTIPEPPLVPALPGETAPIRPAEERPATRPASIERIPASRQALTGAEAVSVAYDRFYR